MSIVLLSILSGCYKDEVDLAALTTNPFDPGYTGPAFIAVTNESTQQVAPNVYNQVLEIAVDHGILQPAASYKLLVTDLNNDTATELQQTAPGSNTFTYTNNSVALGVEYCYTISVLVQFSTTRNEGFCALAEL